MSAYRELIKRGDADHTQLTGLEFILYTGAKLRGGDPVLSEAAAELAALRQRIAELEGERDALRGLAAFAQHHPNCPSQWARSCPCGYTDARNAVAALERR